jgi:hypothetical protein
VRDIEVQAIKWQILEKRAAVDLLKKEGQFERSVQVSQQILELEKDLRLIEDEA